MTLEFRPVYYKDKLRFVKQGDSFDKEKLNIVNLKGTAGIVTLWNKPWDVWKQLRQSNSDLFTESSPLVTLTSLYGNGLPQMLANLANNPQIEYLAVTGNDTKTVPSFTYLSNFLKEGIELPEDGGKLGRIKGTKYPIDPQLSRDLFRNLKMERFEKSDLEGLINFVKQSPTINPQERERKEIKLIEPEFSDFPSDRTTHQIYAQTPTEAWIELIYTLNKFGKNTNIKKGVRRALYNLEVTIENPQQESPDILRERGFDIKELSSYRESILEGKLPEKISYTYGNLLREHFGFDMLDKVVDRLKEDPMDRKAFISLWDNKTHLDSNAESDSSVPCLTDLYFTDYEGKLMLTAGFRTHNATSAWLLNVYGLSAIQEYVAKKAGLKEGRINVKSRWISMDPQDARTNASIEAVKKYRDKKIEVNDPRGYFVVGNNEKEIILEHYMPDGQKLKTYKATTAKEIKDQIRQDGAITNADHAIWMGYQLAMVHLKVHKELPEF